MTRTRTWTVSLLVASATSFGCSEREFAQPGGGAGTGGGATTGSNAGGGQDEGGAAGISAGAGSQGGGSAGDENAPDNGGADNGGADNGGADNGGADNGGADNGGADNGGADNGGADNGGADNGGADNGGADNGGADNGGADNGGADNGGADNGGADNGGADNGGADNGGSGGTGMTGECGDGVVNDDEQCDGTHLGGSTCSLALESSASGTLGCDENCDFDTADCVELDPSAGLSAVRALTTSGDVSISIEGAFVTYVTPVIGTEPAGYFLQGEPNGPALWVAVSPTVEIGDQISLEVTHVINYIGTGIGASVVGSLAEVSQNYDIDNLVQDISDVTDLTTNLASYAAEIVTADVTLSSDFFGSGGDDWMSVQVVTAGKPAPDSSFVLRVPTAVVSELGLIDGCSASVGPVPLIDYNGDAQLTAWRAADIALANCPEPSLLSADARSAGTVLLDFDRPIDEASITDPGTQFTIPGLTVTAAAVVDGNVELTTSAQTPRQGYAVTVADTVEDDLGNAVSSGGDTASFDGYILAAALRINEVNATITGACDLIELRVVAAGSVDGYVLRERIDAIHTFSGTYQKNDLILLHLSSASATCNPTSLTAETTGPNQYPRTANGTNVDTAYDVFIADAGLTSTDNVLAIWDDTAVIDAVFLTEASTGTAAGGTEDAAVDVATAGGWVDAGGNVPVSGFVDDTFSSNSVLDLDATGTDATGATIHRVNDADTNRKADWGTGQQTWGVLNAGQSAL